MHTSLRISIGSANKQKNKTVGVLFSHVPHAVYIFALVDISSKSRVFFCSPFSVLLGESYSTARHLCLHCWHLLWKEFRSLYFRFQLSGYLAKPTLFDETE